MNGFGQPSYRRLGTLVALLALMCAVLVIQAAPASAVSAPNAFTSNICGANGCNWHGATNVLNGLEARMNDHLGNNVIAVGIQEVCFNQFTALQSWLAANKGFPASSGSFWIQSSNASTACGGQTSWYGTAVFTFTAPQGYDTNQFTAQDGGELRGHACIQADFFGTYWACTAHMTPTGSIYPGTSLTYGEEQFQEYTNNVIVPKTSSAVFWGGDTYTVPSRITVAVPNWSYANHLEADRCGGTIDNWTVRNKANGELTKPDWVFRSGTGRTCGGDATLWPANSSDMYPVGTYSSDHRIEMGWWG